MEIRDIISNYESNMIYSLGTNNAKVYRRLSLKCDIDSNFLNRNDFYNIYLSALVYYKSVVSRNNYVLIGVNKNDILRPMIFNSSPNFTRNEHIDEVKSELNKYLEMDMGELLSLYKEYDIDYENIDFVINEENNEDNNYGLINICFSDNNGDYFAQYNYNSSCVSDKEIQRLHSRIISIVNSIVKDDAGRLYDTDIATKEEKDIILNEFNDTKVEYEHVHAHELFSRVAAKLPDKIAIISGDKSITYKGLDEKSNQLARCLRKKGCKRNEFVAIELEKSIELYVSILGVMKAGSAFLPIDPELPKERKEYMIKEANCKFIISNGEENYDLDEEINVYNKSNFNYDNSYLDNINSIDDRIFLLFTSGTTGKPKGVIYKHKGFINTLYAMKEYKCDIVEDKVAQIGRITFTFSFGEIFFTLTRGLTLLPVPNNILKDIPLFNSFIKENHITMLFCTPQFYSMIDAKGCKCKYISTSGGLVDKAILKKAIGEVSIEYKNLFGSTETSYTSRWKSSSGIATNVVPIGKPINNVRVYIMLNNRLCGINTPGEICVAGEGLAEGYLNDKELTNKKFEFSEILGERIYHTGDLGKYLEDGNIIHMGRIDDQIKIRGMRIEINEIENVIAKLDGINRAVVVAKEIDKNDKQLCMYYTANRKIGVKEVKEYLGKYLPDYMIPTWVMQIEEIPVNRHGKVDKKALPDIINSNGFDIVKPKNDIQREVLNAFKEVLKIDNIGITSDFFDFWRALFKGNEIN